VVGTEKPIRRVLHHTAAKAVIRQRGWHVRPWAKVSIVFMLVMILRRIAIELPLF
jgi:hypothetical protein